MPRSSSLSLITFGSIILHFLTLLGTATSSSLPSSSLPFSTLTFSSSSLPSHPRLILTSTASNTIQNYIQNNSIANALFNATLAQGNWYLTYKPEPVPPPTGTPDARFVLQQVYCLGILYRTTKNLTYAYRAIGEIVNVAQAAQWDTNGTAQLNTGEMMHALGMGFDWFYDILNTTEKQILINGIVNNGLNRIRLALGPDPPAWADAFVNTSSNWNSVILGGTIVSCLAVIGEPNVPSWIATDLLPSALSNIVVSFAAWDGGWPEGPNYAGYGVRAGLAPVTMSLLTATGSDGGFLSLPGISLCPRFLVTSMAHTLPDRQYFYWGDTRTIPETISQYLAIARYFNDLPAIYGIRHLIASIPVEYNTTETVAMNAPVGLLYFTDQGTEKDYETLPLVQLFPRDHLVYARSSWNEQDDIDNVYIGFKGSNVSWAWAHNHLDASSFVFAARGQWFAQDLGSDNYNVPSYFGNNRFDVYRTSTLGHNTLSFDGKNQQCTITGKYSSNCSVSPLIVYNVSETKMNTKSNGLTVDAFAIVNLTQAYSYLGIQSAQRGFIIAEGRIQLITVDEAIVDTSSATPSSVKELWWSMHTVANISLSSDNQTATLTTWNVSVPFTITILSPSLCPSAQFTTVPIDLPAPYLPSPGVTRLMITAPVTTCNRLIVALGVDPVTDNYSVRPLAEWNTYGPVQ